MVNRIISIVFAFVVALSIAGCDKISELNQPGAKEVLNGYLDSSLKSRSKEAYVYISSEDKAVKNLSEYMLETDQKDNPFSEVIVSSISFKILKVTESGGMAKADVETTLPDMSVMFKDIMGAAFSAAFGGNDNSKIEEIIAEKYIGGELPTTTKNEEFHLLKEQDGWKVFLDWKSKKAAKEKEEKISALLSDANELKTSKKLSGAILKYEEVLALNGEMVEAKEEIVKAKKEIKEIIEINEKQEYLSKINLYELEAKFHDTYSGRTAGVVFKLKNTGNKILTKIEITVYFKDEKGNIIFEEEYRPVNTSKISFTGDNKPLKPNYVWQMEANKYYPAKSVPSEWKTGSVSANITDIEFE